jgi:hypothetical protein
MRWVTRLAIISLVTLASSSSSGEPSSYKHFDLQNTRFQYMSGGGSDRCDIAHCLCRVSPTVVTPLPQTNITSRRHSVFFAEGSAEVSREQSSPLSKFILESKKLKSSYTVIGYTDDCGTHEYNLGLVRDRSFTIRGAMSNVGISSVDLTVFRPESGFGHNPDARRVDIIAHTRSRVTTMIEKIQADVYLIDASGSMWTGWKSWVDAVAVSFKPGSRVYLSKTQGCVSGQSMEDVTPSGPTEIWYSYWKVLEWMEPGQTLAVVSDFRSNVPLTRREAALISGRVSDKKIKVIAISP